MKRLYAIQFIYANTIRRFASEKVQGKFETEPLDTPGAITCVYEGLGPASAALARAVNYGPVKAVLVEVEEVPRKPIWEAVPSHELKGWRVWAYEGNRLAQIVPAAIEKCIGMDSTSYREVVE